MDNRNSCGGDVRIDRQSRGDGGPSDAADTVGVRSGIAATMSELADVATATMTAS